MLKILVWELVQSLEGTSNCWDLGVCQLVDWLLCFLHLFQDAFGLPWNAQLQTMQMLGQFDTSGLDHKSILKTSGIITYLFTCASLRQQARYNFSPCSNLKKAKKLFLCQFIHGKSAFLPLCLKKAKFSSFWKKNIIQAGQLHLLSLSILKKQKTSFFFKNYLWKDDLAPSLPMLKKSKFSSLKIIIKEKSKLTLILLFGGQFNFKIFVAYVFWFQSWLKLNSKFDLENSCLGRLNGGARFPQTSQMFTSGAFSDIGYGGSVGFCWSGFRGKQNELTLYEQGKRDLKISVDFLRFY